MTEKHLRANYNESLGDAVFRLFGEDHVVWESLQKSPYHLSMQVGTIRHGPSAYFSSDTSYKVFKNPAEAKILQADEEILRCEAELCKLKLARYDLGK